MSMTLDPSTGLIFPDNSIQSTSAYTAWRNKIINGAMSIDQRNNGAAVTVNLNANIMLVDRWFGYGVSAAGVFTGQQVADAPPGFTHSLKVTVTTADANPAANSIYMIGQKIEGYNIAEFKLGTLNASPIPIGFWVKSAKTGTFSGSVGNNNDRSCSFTFTVDATNTWEYKTTVIPAAVAAGSWNITNGVGLILTVDLGSGVNRVGLAGGWTSVGYIFGATGATKLISTLGATMQITGVQLEAGNKASPFERRPPAIEEYLCKRHYEEIRLAAGTVYTTALAAAASQALWGLNYSEKRIAPTSIIVPNGIYVSTGTNATTTTANHTVGTIGTHNARVITTTSGLTAGQAGLVRPLADEVIKINAEL